MSEVIEFGAQPGAGRSRKNPKQETLVDQIYAKLKNDIFEFRILPGDEFTESAVADYVKASRTPVREALFRLENEGYLECRFRNGWLVNRFDFKFFEDLYDIRLVLETAAVNRLCEATAPHPDVATLERAWVVDPIARIKDGLVVAKMDERFHEVLVESTGNLEMAKMHRSITERIRIIRRLDFTVEERVSITYQEHSEILQSIRTFDAARSTALLREHIEASRNEVRKITFERLSGARSLLFAKK